MQLKLEFPTTSPINVDRLTGQNRRLYDWLYAGKKIHCFHPAKRSLQIGYLNSRISDLVKLGVAVKKRWIQVLDYRGTETTVKEYSLIEIRE